MPRLAGRRLQRHLDDQEGLAGIELGVGVVLHREAAAGPEVDHVGLERDGHLALSIAAQGAAGPVLPGLLIVAGRALVVGRGGVAGALPSLVEEGVGAVVVLLVLVLGGLGLGGLAEEGEARRRKS